MRCPRCGYFFVESPETTACPYCLAPVPAAGGEPRGEEARPPGGIPFEQRQGLGFFPSLLETVSGSLFRPGDFFSRLVPEGPYGTPLLYLLATAGVGIFSALLYQVFFSSLGLFLPFTGAEERQSEALASVAALALLPLLLAMMVGGLFIGAAIIHLMLILVGGASRSYNATFRALAYAQGAQLFNLIPLCGGLVGAVWQLVISIIALSEVHDISRGKAALAYFLPFLLCCGLAIAAIALVVGLVGAGSLAELWRP